MLLNVIISDSCSDKCFIKIDKLFKPEIIYDLNCASFFSSEFNDELDYILKVSRDIFKDKKFRVVQVDSSVIPIKCIVNNHFNHTNQYD